VNQVKLADVFIGGLGTFVPDVTAIEDAVGAGLADPEFAATSGYTGAAVAGDLPPVEMALRATRQALDRAGPAADRLAALFYVDNYDNGPIGWYPQSFLQRCAVGGDLLAAEVRQGCNGVLTAVELAGGYLMGLPGPSSVLIAAADNMSLPQINRWRCLSPDFIVGDGAAALVLTRTPTFAEVLSASSLTVPELEGMHRGDEPLFPPGSSTGADWDFARRIEDFYWRASNDDGVSHLWLPLVKARAELIDRVLDEAGIAITDVTRLVYNHAARQHVEDGLLGVLGLPLSRSNWEFGRHLGHLGACDQVVSLDHMLTAGDLAPGDHVLMLGLSPGVNIAGAVVRIVDTPPWLR
jgi:3-oxoacyl-[acyl-carrier-protein] synthase-3